MFAFAIYDEASQKLFACRDRAGTKPFFYYWKNGLFLFALKLKAIVNHPSFVKTINIDAVAAFMQHGYVPTPNCIFNDAHKLKPGHFLEMPLSNRTISTQQYWNVYDAYNKPTLKIDLPEAVTETEKILSSAFQYRMVSDVPVGVFLSGGYDSTCVTALLQKDNTEKIKTFTIGFADTELNEAPFAKEIAAYLGTDHTEYYCTEKEALEIIPELSFYYDEPFADPSAVPTTLVSRIAREKVTVALSADAGDEIFAGYNSYDFIVKYSKRFNNIPAPIRNIAASLMGTISPSKIPGFNKRYVFEEKYKKVISLLKDPSPLNMVKSLMQQVKDYDVDGMFTTSIKKLPSAFDSKELKPEYFSDLAFIMAMDYQTYLNDDILQKVDRAGMSVSLEGREPFLDQRIIEWAAQLPMDFKYHNGSKKFILKEIVHKHIPKAMMDRPKKGFGVPVFNWLQKDLKPLVDMYFEDEYIIKQGIFNVDAIRRMKQQFYVEKTGMAEKVWSLLMFQLWYDKWMNNN